MKVEYGSPLPCPNCGCKEINCRHVMGAQCYCSSCGIYSTHIAGNNWQDEEREAVEHWNAAVKKYEAEKAG